jgi:soluble lytic murein transglycosylase-like protein
MQKIAQCLCLPAMLMACTPAPGHANAPTTPIEATSLAAQTIANGAIAQETVWQAPKTLRISLNSSSIALPPCHPDAVSTPKPHPSLNARMEAQRRQHWPVVVAAACSVGIPLKLLDALIIQESKYNQAAVSTAGAAGLMQLMPQTAAALGVRNRFSAHESIWGGSRYLKSLL